MGIIAINTQTTGLAGPQTKPHRCTIITTDNLATIMGAGYLNGENIFGVPIENNDLFDVLYSYNQQTQQGTYGKFITTSVNGTFTLQSVENTNLLPDSTQTVYVSLAGSDATGNGSITNPYLTITKAMSSIVDATSTKRYAINIGPGIWTDNFSLKANVMLYGMGYDLTFLSGVIDINDASWNNDNDNRSYIYNLTINQATTFDFTVQSASQGKLYFNGCELDDTVTFTAFNSINQVFVSNSVLFGGWTQTGITFLIWASNVLGGAITVNSSGLADTECLMLGCPAETNMIVTGTGSEHIECDLFNSFIQGGIAASGSNCNILTSVNTLPITGNSFTGGATLVTSPAYVSGILVAEGANAYQGVATLVGGTVTVSNTNISANSRIFLTAQDNLTVGALRVSARVAGTSFTITSSSGTDTGVVAYEIFQPT